MRPVTFARIAEAVREIGGHRDMEPPDLAERLEMTPSRSHEVVREAYRIGLVCDIDGRLTLTERGRAFAGFCSDGQWNRLHAMMMETSPYADLARLLGSAEKSLSASDILALTVLWSVPLNAATLDVLLDWMERLGFSQRNVFTGRHYCLNGSTLDFQRALVETYRSLNRNTIPWLPLSFVEIPRLREGCANACGSVERFSTSL